jgi:hypothetical protein
MPQKVKAPIVHATNKVNLLHLNDKNLTVFANRLAYFLNG